MDIDLKDCHVAVVEKPLLERTIKEWLCEILYFHFQAASISWIDSSVAALAAVQKTCGLVVDCGYLDTVIVPVSLEIIQGF